MTITNAGNDVEQHEFITGGNTDGAATMKDSLAVCYKLNIDITYVPAISFLGN